MSLTVTLQSFSYKKGIPTDPYGNGGGFVFDCRGIYNPGRLEPFKTKNGLDQEVQDFIDSQTEMQYFLKHTFGIVELTVKSYLERGFDHLQVCFGCTGGQHRSVYATEKMTEYLQSRFPEVTLIKEHTNQENWVKQ